MSQMAEDVNSPHISMHYHAVRNFLFNLARKLRALLVRLRTKSLEDFAQGSLDFVFSSHCLEHNAEWKPVLNQWTSKLKRDGVLFLYLPHPECGIWEPGSPFVGDEHKWSPTPEIIKSTMQDSGFSLVAYDDGPDVMYSFWVCARKDV